MRVSADVTELILDHAHSAVISMDERGVVSYWNPSAERIFGISSKQALGRAVAELIVPERLRAAHRAGLERFLAEGKRRILDRRIELDALRGDGSEFPAEVTVSALHGEGGWSFHAFVLDVSERRAAERERERLTEELRAALRGAERRFDAIVGALSDPVTIRGRDHRFLYANRAALDYLGFDSWERLRETPPSAIMDDYEVRGEDGREIAMDDIPSVRILRGEPAPPLLIRTVHKRSGEERWNLLKAAPLLDEQGEPEATIMIIEGVTGLRRAQLRSSFLAQAAETLASSLDYEQTLHNVAQLAVPRIADWCAVDLLDEDGDRRTVALAHMDPEQLAVAQELHAHLPERVDPTQALGRVLSTGQSVLHPRIDDEMLARAARDERHLQLLRALRLRSALIVPMRLGARILGALTLGAESARVLDRHDVELAEQVAARAATAIENSRLYSERSAIARTLQRSLLPERLPAMPGYELASMYVPAHETSMVGGDFYDVWPLADAWMVAIGDMTGKGIEAAALTALVRHTLRAASEFDSSPATLLALVDTTLKKRAQLSVCTALCLRVQGETVTMAVGGHPPPLCCSAAGVRPLGGHGPLLGAFAGARWQEFSVRLQVGSVLVAYTDGVTDAQDEHERRFGAARLRDALAAHAGESAAALMDGLAGALEAFQSGAHADDTAVLALRRTGGVGGGEETTPSPTLARVPTIGSAA